jgi:hypothetical protein
MLSKALANTEKHILRVCAFFVMTSFNTTFIKKILVNSF